MTRVERQQKIRELINLLSKLQEDVTKAEVMIEGLFPQHCMMYKNVKNGRICVNFFGHDLISEREVYQQIKNCVRYLAGIQWEGIE